MQKGSKRDYIGLLIAAMVVAQIFALPVFGTEIEKSVDKTNAMLGEDLAYTIRVNFTENASNVTIADYLPEGLVYINDSLNGTLNGRNITWQLGNVSSVLKILLNASINETYNGPKIASNFVNLTYDVNDSAILHAKTVSDANGDYDFSDFTDGDYTVIAVKYVSFINNWTMGRANVSVESGQSLTDTDLYLTTAEDEEVNAVLGLIGNASVSGKILSNTPFGVMNVSNATVVILKEQSVLIKTISDYDGYYYFSDFADGDYTVIAFNYVSFINSWIMGKVNVTIENGQNLNDIELYLTTAGAEEVNAILELIGNASVSGKILSNTPFGVMNVSDATVVIIKEQTGMSKKQLTAGSQQVRITDSNASKDAKIAFVIMGEEGIYISRRASKEVGINISVYGSYRRHDVNITYTPISDMNLSEYDLIFIGTSAPGPTDESMKSQIITTVNNTKDENAYIIDRLSYGKGIGNVNLTEHYYIQEYWDNQCIENTKRLITYLAVTFFDENRTIQEPIISPPYNGIYHPDTDMIFDNLTSYLEWYGNDDSTHHVYNPDNITVGLTFWKAYDDPGGPVVNDAIRRLEARGINVIPVYQPHLLYVETDKYFMQDNKSAVDAFIDFGAAYWIIPAVIKDTTYLQTINVPVINAIMYEGSIDEWRNSTTGSDFHFNHKIPVKEIGGQIESIVVSGKEYNEEYDVMVDKPIDSQMEWMIDRTLSWIKLQNLNNSDKTVAIIYYHHSPGRHDTMVASNLDVGPSISNLLEGMNDRGYNLNGTLLNKTELLDLVLKQGRNVGVWCPDDLKNMVETYDVALLPVDVYLDWFNELPEKARNEVLTTWGPPPGDMMVYENETGEYFVFPKISLGNILIAPQATRGSSQNNTLLYHDQTSPPSHQYIAFYFWLKKEYGADAIIHFGRHGTQEWLKGKGVGLSVEDCWPAIVIQDMPVVYLYDVGGIGEGIMAKRRGNSVIVDHSTPPIVNAGLYGNLSNLHHKIHLYSEAEEATLKQEYRNTIIEIYRSLKFEEDLNVSADALINMTTEEFENFVITGPVHDYLHELAAEFMPYGMHILAECASGDKLVSMVKSLLRDKFIEHVAQVYEDEHALDPAHEPNLIDYLLMDVIINGSTPEEALKNILNITGSATIELLSKTMSDANGNYDFSDLADGNYTVISFNYVPFISSWSMGEVNVTIENGQDVSDKNIYLTTADTEDVNAVQDLIGNASISGKILSSTPFGVVNVSNATVVLKKQSILSKTMSDANGYYDFSDLADGNYTVISFNYVPFISSWSMGEVNVTIENGQDVSDKNIYLTTADTEDVNAVQDLIGNASISGKILSSTPFGVVNVSNATVVIIKKQSELPLGAEEIIADLYLAIKYAEDVSGCTIEIPRMLDALEGKFIPPGLGDDPIRSPHVLPTGRNFYAFNPYIVPTEESWKVGKRLADEFLVQWVNETGEYPRKVGFVMWSTETTRHKGVMESEILYLLGVKPTWDSFGNVVDVELMNCCELGRPRIDVVVTMSGIYRDDWEWQVKLMDRAVRMAAQANDTECIKCSNFVKENSELIYDLLMETGNYTKSEASALSMTRVFGPPAGMWGVGGFIGAVGRSSTWEDESQLADLYIRTMSNPYGEDIWGGKEVDLFKEVLDGTEAVLFSRSGNDNRGSGSVIFDHVFEFFGGMGLAIRDISGKTPEMYIVNLRDPDEAKTETLSEFLMRDVRSKYFNPKWIQGMMEHDYAGAREISSMLEDFWGLEVTLPDVVTESMWNEMYEVYITDKHDLGLEKWFNENNPWAVQSITARMLEAVRKGYWDPSDEVKTVLAETYQKSVEEYGITCCHHTCGNPFLDSYMEGIVSAPMEAEPQGEEPSTQISRRSGGGGRRTEEEKGLTNETAEVSGVSKVGEELKKPPEETGEPAEKVKKGKVMKEEEPASTLPISGAPLMGLIVVISILVFVGVGFWLKRRK